MLLIKNKPAFNAIAIFALILFFVFIAGCAQKQETQNPVNSINSSSDSSIPSIDSSINSSGSFLKGVSLSPKSFNANDFTEFLSKAKQSGKILSWAGEWSELNKENSAPKVVMQIAEANDLIPAIIVSIPSESDSMDEFKQSVVLFAEKFHPKYFGLGNEINVIQEKNPAEFNEFAEEFNSIYDSIKEKSSETKVFTVFQLEKMKGLNGGLFGGKNDETRNQWNLIQKFSKADFIAFTSYPSLVFRSPEEIPSNYYSEISLHVSKPVAFTEIGWHSNASPVGWEGSEEKQKEFVLKFFELNEKNGNGNSNLEFVVWAFLFDQETIEPFNSMGLIDSSGKEKKAWDEWINGK